MAKSAASEDSAVLERIRATASRRGRARWRLPPAIPLETLAVAVPWLLACSPKIDPDWWSIGLRGAGLAAMTAALVLVRRLGSPPLEIGWRFLLAAQLLGLLQAATLQPSLPPGATDKLHAALWTAGALSLFWGLRLDRRSRTMNVDRLKRAVIERRDAHRRFVDLVDTVEGIVWEATADPFELEFVSRRAGSILGFEPEAWMQQPSVWFERIHPEDRERVMRTVAEKAKSRDAYRLEYRMIAADGRTVWVRDLVNVVADRDGVVKLRGVTVDVTETKLLEQRLRHNANHDALTGLPNRVAFTAALERAFRNAAPDAPFAVLFLDLDRFKMINDTMGHMAGDAVLEEAAARIGRAVRSRDVVARLGGDEFAVLAESLHSPDEAIDLANRLRDELNRPVEVGGRNFALSATVGIKLAAGGSGSAKEILRDADTAMYCAKERARGSQQVFQNTMHDRLVADMDAESEIRAGVEGHRLELRYKPIVELADDTVFGYEAALCWRDDNGRLFGAEDYAVIAQQPGLASPLGWSVLRQTLLAAKAGAADGPTIVAPLFAALLEQPDLLERLDKALEETAAPPERLILAVPEQAAAAEEAYTALHALTECGFRLALTDFGAGRASLHQLCRLPLSFARITPSMPSSRTGGGPEASLLQAMTKLCSELTIRVIADGVRTTEQGRLLHHYGCDLGQGPLWGAVQSLSPIGSRSLIQAS